MSCDVGEDTSPMLPGKPPMLARNFITTFDQLTGQEDNHRLCSVAMRITSQDLMEKYTESSKYYRWLSLAALAG